MKRLISIVFIALVALVVLNSQPASATILTVEVIGVADSVETAGGFTLDGSVVIGTEMTGYCTYDTETPDQDPNEFLGTYPVISVSMTVGNYTFTHNPDSPDSALFKIQKGADFYYKVQSSTSVFDGLIYLNGLPENYEDIIWDDTHLEPIDVRGLGDVLPNDALPTVDTFPGLSAFNWERSFDVHFKDNNNNYFLIYGNINSLEVVPEPATLLLLGLGSFALLTNRKFR